MTQPTNPYQRPQMPPTAPQWRPRTGPMQGPPPGAWRPPMPPRPMAPPVHPEALKYYQQQNFDRSVYRWNKIWFPLIMAGVLGFMVVGFLIWDAIVG